jgi:hypothetical protein
VSCRFRSSPSLARSSRRPLAERLAPLLFAAALISVRARDAGAQLDWRGEAGVTRVQPSTTTQRDALFLSGFVQQAIGPLTPLLSGAATIAGDSVAAAQLILAATAVPPWSSRLPIDIGALVALYGIAAGDRGTSRSAFVRQHVLTDRGGYWLGGSIAQTERERAFASNALELGVWRALGIFRFTALASTTQTNDRDVFRNSLPLRDVLPQKVRVADATLIGRIGGDRIDVEAVLGMRYGIEGLGGRRDFGMLSVAVRAFSDAYVVASSGSQLADPLRGTPEWRFVSLGLRFASDAADGRVRRSRLGPLVAVERVSREEILVVIAAPLSARRVEIKGSVSDWLPVAAERADRGWGVRLPAVSGAHQLQVRIDGGSWRVPANLPVVVDEYGVRSGLIVIPDMGR